jgi:SAM-dependent methyltransferase
MNMRFMDRVPQNWRGRKTRRRIRPGARVVDIGCHQGEFLLGLGDPIGASVEIDPLATPACTGTVEIRSDSFEKPMPLEDGSFDAIVMLATLEHIQDTGPLAEECGRLLTPRRAARYPCPRAGGRCDRDGPGPSAACRRNLPTRASRVQPRAHAGSVWATGFELQSQLNPAGMQSSVRISSDRSGNGRPLRRGQDRTRVMSGGTTELPGHPSVTDHPFIPD